MPYTGKQSRKFLVELEALRGLAAIVVLIHHFMLGFTPRFHGYLYPDQPFSLMGTPAFALINGSGAVAIFFVLSGFVLSGGLFKSRSLRGALISAVKRWRLPDDRKCHRRPHGRTATL
jgi:peptidoglycan/LPS O-acetylase OafA/YrhL